MADIGKIVGTRDYDFISSEGQRITGRTFFCVVNSGSTTGKGLEVAQVGATTQLMSTWVTMDLFTPDVGDIAEICYTRRGKLAGFRRVDESASKLFDSLFE